MVDYNCVCPGCTKRWNDGKDKKDEVEMVRCEKCAEKKIKRRTD